MDGVTVAVTGAFGIAGNLMTILVLFRSPARTCFQKLLIALAVFDTTFLLVGGASYCVRGFGMKNWVFNLLFPHFIHPFR